MIKQALNAIRFRLTVVNILINSTYFKILMSSALSFLPLSLLSSSVIQHESRDIKLLADNIFPPCLK